MSVLFGVVSHICIHSSNILVYVSSCDVAGASTDLTAAVSASVLVKRSHCSDFAKIHAYVSTMYLFAHINISAIGQTEI